MAEWKDWQTLFHRTLLSTTGGPASMTAVDWDLKNKDIEYDGSLTKNYYTIVMQKFSLIHNSFLR